MNTDKIYSVLVPYLRPLVVGRFGGARRQYFTTLPVSPGQVVFLGDSITADGKWSDLFPELRTANRGIGGESTVDLLERLHTGICEPSAVSLLIGTNDLHGPRDGRAVPGIAARTDRVVEQLRERYPAALLLLNGVMPRTPYFAERIRSLNEEYQRIAEQRGATFVDTWPALADSDGGIRKELTRDNLHLNAAGYLVWADVLRPHLAPFRP